MKIVVFSPFYPPHIGGVEIFSEALNERLARESHSLTVFTPRLPSSASAEENKKGVVIIRFPAFEIVHNYPVPKPWKASFWKCLVALRREKFDVVVSHTRFFSSTLLAIAFSKATRTPLVHIEHGSSFPKTGGPIVSSAAYLYDRILGKMILKEADHVIAVSEAARGFVQELANRTDVTTIYRGFDIDGIRHVPEDSAWRQDDGQTVKIAYIGRLVDGKGVHDLIGALARIKDLSWKCAIVGEGPEKVRLLGLAQELGITDRIVFFGEQTHARALAILKASDIFINPSYSEGMPTTVVEAAICGKAVIATDVGGTREIIGNDKAGILVDPDSPTQLAEALRMLLGSSERAKRMGAEALQSSEEKFSWEQSLRKYQDIFQRYARSDQTDNS
jgi:glycosyltransferase involved in cell wall biosynthesis